MYLVVYLLVLLQESKILKPGINFKSQLLQYQLAQEEEFETGFQQTWTKEDSKFPSMAELILHSTRLQDFKVLGRPRGINLKDVLTSRLNYSTNKHKRKSLG